MALKPLAADISVTTQLTPEAIASAKAAGFHTIINNRPDGEEPGQPSSAELAEGARTAGVEYHHIPVVPGHYTEAQIDAFCAVMEGCDKPAVAFCKSGMRATSLWALSQAGKRPIAEILGAATKCGYDLKALEPRIEARAKAIQA